MNTDIITKRKHGQTFERNKSEPCRKRTKALGAGMGDRRWNDISENLYEMRHEYVTKRIVLKWARREPDPHFISFHSSRPEDGTETERNVNQVVPEQTMKYQHKTSSSLNTNSDLFQDEYLKLVVACIKRACCADKDVGNVANNI